MSVEKELMPNEQIIHQTKPHWIVFSGTAGWLAGAFAIYVLGELYHLEWLRIGAFIPIYQAVAIIFCLLGVLSFAASAVHYAVTLYVITTRRVLMQTGFFQRETSGILLQKIEMVKVFQPLLGRILGYGGVMIIGVGGTNDPFPNIPDPIVWREKVQYQIQQINQASSNASYK